MSREIKFRGIDCGSKEFVYGNLVNVSCRKDPKPETAWRIVVRGMDCIIHIPVRLESVGQYTGLKDRNGREIYEGDVVNYEDCETGVEGDADCYINKGEVIWDETCGMWELTNKNELHIFDLDWKTVEVIGNIHENPEMLK